MSGDLERVKAILEKSPETVNARGPKNVRCRNDSSTASSPVLLLYFVLVYTIPTNTQIYY